MARKSSPGKSSKKKLVGPVFASIRKPTAPPGHALSNAKPAEVARPALRKAKHKKPPEPAED